MATLLLRILEPAKIYIETLSEADKGAIAADMDAMTSGEFDAVNTKQLRGPIRELISGHHRISYFKLEPFLCFVRGFRKKTGKTPKKEIEYAASIHHLFQKQLKK